MNVSTLEIDETITIGTGFRIDTLIGNSGERRMAVYHSDSVKVRAALDALQASSSFRGLGIAGCWFRKECNKHYLLISPSTFYKVTPQHRSIVIGLLGIPEVIETYASPR